MGENGSGKSHAHEGPPGSLKEPSRAASNMRAGSNAMMSYLRSSALQKDFPASEFEVVSRAGSTAWGRRFLVLKEDKKEAELQPGQDGHARI